MDPLSPDEKSALDSAKALLRSYHKRSDAARNRVRRSAETALVQDLGEQMTIPHRTLRQLDKTSILRLALAEIKLRTMFGSTFSGEKGPTLDFLDLQLDEAIGGGFLVVVLASGELLYMSESVEECLGISNWQLVGHNVYDFAPNQDWADLNQLLAVTCHTGGDGGIPTARSGLVRLKSSLRLEQHPHYHPDTANRVIQFSGKMFLQSPNGGSNAGFGWPCFVGVGRIIPYLIPAPQSRTFISFHQLNTWEVIKEDPK